MVIHSMDEGQQPIDLEKLAALGDKVWPGGGEEILRYLRLSRMSLVRTHVFVSRLSG